MAIPLNKPSKAELMSKVARFKDIKEVSTGLPDMDIDGYRRSFLSIMDFGAPEGEDQVSPTGNAVVPAVVEPTASFGLAYIKARAGNGVMMHNHDTNESFLVIDGRWSISWEGSEGRETVVLDRLDFMTLPPHINRSFRCEAAAPEKDHGLLLGIVAARTGAGTAAAAEFSPEALEMIRSAELEKSANSVS